MAWTVFEDSFFEDLKKLCPGLPSPMRKEADRFIGDTVVGAGKCTSEKQHLICFAPLEALDSRNTSAANYDGPFFPPGTSFRHGEKTYPSGKEDLTTTLSYPGIDEERVLRNNPKQGYSCQSPVPRQNLSRSVPRLSFDPPP